MLKQAESPFTRLPWVLRRLQPLREVRVCPAQPCLHSVFDFANIEYNQSAGFIMQSRTSPTTLTVRLNSTLASFVAANVGEIGEQARFEQLKAELMHAFRAPDDTFHPLTAAEVIARNAN